MIGLADLLTRAGYKTEAKEALQVVLLFPTYANSYFGSDKPEATSLIVNNAQQVLLGL